MSNRAGIGLPFLFLSLLASVVAGQAGALPEITAASDTAWHDLTFRIQQKERRPEGAQLLRVAGTYRTTPVAIGVLLGPTWKEGRLGDLSLVTYSGTVSLRSLGEQSDRLIVVLDELYATGQHPRRMRQQTEFTAITLAGDPSHLSAGPVKIK